MTSDIELFSNIDAVIAATKRAAENLIPPPDILPSVWAEANIRIPLGNAIPGNLNFDNAPFQRKMIDAIKEPGIRRISYKTGAQVGKTLCQQVITSYYIAHEARSQLFCTPTQNDSQTFLNSKLRPTFDGNKAISSKLAKQRGREGTNNSRMISYIGGFLGMCWAGSPKTLRGRSAPVTHADEIDGFPVTAEGNALELLAQRSASFGDMALRTESSTPTIKGASNIDVCFDEGDQREFYIACPECEHAQTLVWSGVRWDGRRSVDIKDYEEDIGCEHLPDTALYCCAECGSLLNDGQRIAAIRTAESKGHGWKASKPFDGHASFYAPEMLSTFRRLRDIVRSYLNKIALGDIQSFTNVSLGLSYEESGEKADPDSLMQRREVYAAQVPARGLFLTAGVDMQIDRLEVEVVAWGHGEESWSIDYRVLWGDPMCDDVWQELDDMLAEPFEHESGNLLPISATCLDTGGTAGYTQAAYDYAKGKTGRRLFAIKGVGGWGPPIVEKPQRKQSGKNARKVDLFLVGVDEAKLITQRRLATAKPGPGYCHFPDDRDAEYFKQLTAEKLLTRYVKGQPVREWHKPDKARNEAGDCRNYAYAALKVMNPSFKRLEERLRSEAPMPAPAPRPAPEKPQEDAPAPKPDNTRVIKARRTLKKSSGGSGWAKKW